MAAYKLPGREAIRSAFGAKLTILAAPQNVCFQGQSGPFFMRPDMSANDPKRTSGPGAYGTKTR